MLDQSFSTQNFKKIIEIENRKGNYLEGKFFDVIEDLTNKIKEINSNLKLLKRTELSSIEYKARNEKLVKEKEGLKEKKEKELEKLLSEISKTVTSPQFSLEVIPDSTISEKIVYKTDYKIENILTQKQLQYNFRKLYKVKQANRYSIICQLKNLLDDGFPKIILKTDIKNFYESIPQNKLMKKINDDNLLTHSSRKFIRQLILSFNKHTGKDIGVPRGIGISAYLVELYMREIDDKIKAMPQVMYYARYVDDIVVIYMPSIVNDKIDYMKGIKDILHSEGLTINENIQKTKFIDLSNKSQELCFDFDYLGYRFISGFKKSKHMPLKLTISTKKRKKYIRKIYKAFDLYILKSKGNEKKARKLLVKRLNFFTSNVKLVNNKKNILTGIYYSNSLINDKRDLIKLDRFYQYLLNKLTLPNTLKNRLKSKYSFLKGFNSSQVKRFKVTELNNIIQGWDV